MDVLRRRLSARSPLRALITMASGVRFITLPEPTPPLAGALPVTVVIPAHNRAELIGRAVASAKAQHAPPAEILVIDDGSEDQTPEIAERAGARVIRLPENRGAAAARLAGIRAASHDWVAFLDSDDEWLPWMLSTLWPLRDGHVLLAGASIWFRDGQRERYEGLPTGEAAVLADPKPLVWPQNFVPAGGVLARRDAILQTSPEAPKYRYSEDFATWLRLLTHGTGLVVARPVVRYHLHAGQKSASPARLIDQRAIVRDIAGDQSWGSRLLRRRMEADAWHEARTPPRDPIGPLLRRNLRPRRALGVGFVLLWTRLQKRRFAALTPAGDLELRRGV
jgi:GT2 family glycosyltransferase